MTQSPKSTGGVRLRDSVAQTVDRLQHHYLHDQYGCDGADARSALAELRKASAFAPEKNPIGLQHMLAILTPPLDERLIGRGETPSPSEAALYRSLSLFGVHMQSAKRAMHTREVSFANACGQLVPRSGSKSIKPRFDALQLAPDDLSRAVHLRSIVSLLRGYEIAFDYGSFAEDIRTLADRSRRPTVLLRWGRDFARGAQYHQDAPGQERPESATSADD